MGEADVLISNDVEFFGPNSYPDIRMYSKVPTFF